VTARALRWAVIGTANIAAKAFLPAMRAAGDTAVVVGSRDPERARGWAAENQVGRAASYADAVAADDVDAVYISVPNDLHVTWAARAAAAGRAVLCEKPLGVDAEQVARLLDETRGALLWEAFVFPFHPQTARLAQLCAPDGPIGGLREIISEFHFRAGSPENIRWSAERGGGALMDVGCYPVRLARLLYDAEPTAAAASSVWAGSGVDAETASVLDFPDDRRLILSAGLQRYPSTFTRLIGDSGELLVSNPFHPTDRDVVELWRDGERVESWPAGPQRAFQYAVEHIDAVVSENATPRFLATDTALGNARALDLVREAARR
jgi:predicted dehydrogenase